MYTSNSVYPCSTLYTAVLGYTFTPGSDGLIYAAESDAPAATRPLQRYFRSGGTGA